MLTTNLRATMLLVMMRGKLFLTIGGLLLAATGLTLFNIGQTPQKIAAQTGYTTNWSASEVYQVRATNGQGNSVDTIAIGVSKWMVTGEIGGANFTETWSGPDSSTAVFSLGVGAPTQCSTNNYDRNLWLLGCTLIEPFGGAGRITYRLFSVPANSVYHEGLAQGGRGWSGGGSLCESGGPPIVLSECMVTTGTYGFSYVNFGSGSAGHDGLFHGLAMPLKWTVVGTIN